jgi:hypothetical protein
MSGGARRGLLKRQLTEASLAKSLRLLLPRINNYSPVNYTELLEELRHFGVYSRRDLRRLVLRNVRKAVKIDRAPFDKINASIQRKELGSDMFQFLDRRRIFYNWAGLLRVILELEFGERYCQYKDSRYGSDSVEAVSA